MFQYLDDLTKNNDHPPDKALLEVKELLSKPLKQLEETNAEINRLEELVQGLKERRTEIEKTIGRYSCILSPIRRVPSDILHTIFAHCLPTHRNPTMSASESPMLLTRVCGIWRSTALTSPRLWAQIHIPFRVDGEVQTYAGHPSISREKVSDTLRLRCRAAREWLSRSGDCPLAISISYPIYRGFDTEWSDKSTALLLETIVSYSSRWRSLELNTPLEVYWELENMLSAYHLSELVQLRVSVYGPACVDDLEPTLELLKSRHLQRVSIHLPPTGNSLLPVVLSGHNITHLSDQSYCTIQDFFILLKSCPCLIHGDFIINTDQSFEMLSEIISLPCLTSLWITEILHISSMMNNLYDFIYAPKLLWIEYRNKGYISSPHHHVPDDSLASSIRSLVARTTELKTLAIDRFFLSPYNVVKALEMAPQDCLTKLVLNSRDVSAREYFPDPFDLVLLIVDGAGHPDLTTPTNVLLPRLEVFQLESTRESDVTVLRFIISRMKTLSPIAVLRKVKIVFDRLKEQNGIDIAEEVRAQAVEVGVHIDLNLHYSPPLAQIPGYIHPLSPSILGGGYQTGPTNRTWEYRELEDEENDI